MIPIFCFRTPWTSLGNFWGNYGKLNSGFVGLSWTTQYDIWYKYIRTVGVAYKNDVAQETQKYFLLFEKLEIKINGTNPFICIFRILIVFSFFQEVVLQSCSVWLWFESNRVRIPRLLDPVRSYMVGMEASLSSSRHAFWGDLWFISIKTTFKCRWNQQRSTYSFKTEWIHIWECRTALKIPDYWTEDK